MDSKLLLISIIGSLVLVFSVFASKATSRFGVPILLIFIVVGMFLGQDGPGGIHFNNFAGMNVFGTAALIFILFSGGFSANPIAMKPIWKEGVTLSTVGVFLTTLFMTTLIHYTMDWNWTSSALLSAGISSTDAAAVFGVLRTQKMEVKSRLRALVELEGGSNDPMAVVLLFLLIQFSRSPEEATMLATAQKFFVQVAFGGIAGWLAGKLLVKIINWLSLDFEGLYPVLTMASVICLYSVTEYCGGNGYLAVFIAGFTMSNEKFLSKKSLLVFHDGLSWLMQVGMFIALGLLVNPMELRGVAIHSAVFAIALIFIARPLAVVLCLLPFGYRNWRELAFISWGGLKGAVAIILATYLLMENVPHAKIMFNVIFFIVIISLTIQGATIGKVSQLLGVCDLRSSAGDYETYQSPRKTNEFIEFEIPHGSSLIGRTIFDLKLPDDVLVVLVHRDDEDFIPKGSTVILEEDRLVCLVNRNVIPDVVELLRRGMNGSPHPETAFMH